MAAVTDFFPLREFPSPFSIMTLSTAIRCTLCCGVFLLVTIRTLRYVWRFALGWWVGDVIVGLRGYWYGLEGLVD